MEMRMKHIVPLACLVLACFELSAAASTMTITSNLGVDVTVKITLAPADSDNGPTSGSFVFTTAKGLLGPSSNPADQSGFANAAKDLFAITVEPVTKAAFVHLFLTRPKGNLILLGRINSAVAKLLPARWRSEAKEYLRVEEIDGRKIKLQTTDYSTGPFKTYAFWVSVSRKGEIRLAQ